MKNFDLKYLDKLIILKFQANGIDPRSYHDLQRCSCIDTEGHSLGDD